MLEEKATNHNTKLYNLRNVVLPQITSKRLKAVEAANQNDTSKFIMKRRVANHEEAQTLVVDAIIGSTGQIAGEANSINIKATQRPNKFKFTSLESNKPPRLTV